MKRHSQVIAFTVWSVLAMVLSVPAHAQGAGFLAQSAFSTGNGPQCGAALASTVTQEYRGFSATVVPAPLTSADPLRWLAPAVSAGWKSKENTAWRFEAEGAVGAANADCASLSSVSRAHARLSRNFSRSGVALGWGSRSLSSLDPSRDREGVTASYWQQLHQVRFDVDVRSHRAGPAQFMQYSQSEHAVQFDSVYSDTTRRWNPLYRSETVTDSTPATRVRRALDLLTRLQWTRGRVALNLAIGGTAGTIDRFRSPSSRSDTLSQGGAEKTRNAGDPLVMRVWGRGDVRFAATSLLDITAGVAALPSQPVIGAPARRVALIGVGLNGLPRAVMKSATEKSAKTAMFSVVRTDSTRVLVRFRVPNAVQVEVSGEPTSWQPLTMHRSGSDWWEAELFATSGSYRMNIRVDGRAWSVPPGSVPTRDEFGGEVGLVVLK